MKKQELLQQASEMRQAMKKAAGIADQLRDHLSAAQEPAISAICNVIRSYLLETEKQEEIFSDMLNTKLQD
ncbi:MAG: hypothetical protein D6730_05330 [Bacteroidetes bacterium]|nr:MAG: hypothetical protein D6730_05330 [Bacteroidota bacterium]